MLPAARGAPPSSNTEQESVQGGSVTPFPAVGSSKAQKTPLPAAISRCTPSSYQNEGCCATDLLHFCQLRGTELLSAHHQVQEFSSSPTQPDREIEPELCSPQHEAPAVPAGSTHRCFTPLPWIPEGFIQTPPAAAISSSSTEDTAHPAYLKPWHCPSTGHRTGQPFPGLCMTRP